MHFWRAREKFQDDALSSEIVIKNKFHVFNGIFVRREKWKKSCECLFGWGRKNKKAFFNEGFEKLILWTEEDKLYSPTKIHITIKLTATTEKRERDREETMKSLSKKLVKLIGFWGDKINSIKTVININIYDKSFLSLYFADACLSRDRSEHLNSTCSDTRTTVKPFWPWKRDENRFLSFRVKIKWSKF